MLSPNANKGVGIAGRHSPMSLPSGPGSPCRLSHKMLAATSPSQSAAAAASSATSAAAARMHHSMHGSPLQRSCCSDASQRMGAMGAASASAKRSLFGSGTLKPATHAVTPTSTSIRVTRPLRPLPAPLAALPGQHGTAAGLFNWLQIPFSNPSFAAEAMQQQREGQLREHRKQQLHPQYRKHPQHEQHDRLEDPDYDTHVINSGSTASALVHSVAVLLVHRLLLPSEPASSSSPSPPSSPSSRRSNAATTPTLVASNTTTTATPEALRACEDALILIVDGMESGVGGIPPEQMVPELLRCGLLPALANLICGDPAAALWPAGIRMPRAAAAGAEPASPQAHAGQGAPASDWDWANVAAAAAAQQQQQQRRKAEGGAPGPDSAAVAGLAEGESEGESQLVLRSLALETLYTLLSRHLLPEFSRYTEAAEQLHERVVPHTLGALAGYVRWLEACSPARSASAGPGTGSGGLGLAAAGGGFSMPVAGVRCSDLAEVGVGCLAVDKELLNGLTAMGLDTASAPAWLQSAADAMPQAQQHAPHGQVQGPGVGVDGVEGVDEKVAQLWVDVGTAGLSCLRRLASMPDGASTLVAAGAVPLLCQLLHMHPSRPISQACLVLLHKLSHPAVLPSPLAALAPIAEEAIDTFETAPPSSALPGAGMAEVAGMASIPEDAVDAAEVAMEAGYRRHVTLAKEAAAGAQRDNALAQLLASGAVPDLCALLAADVTSSGGGPATATGGLQAGEVSDVVGSLLLDMAGMPGASERFAQQGLVAHVVPLLQPRYGPATRMWALLALCRLASRSSVCQMDIVREGAVPSLVEMLSERPDPEHEVEEEDEEDDEQGSTEAQRRTHAARLLALLCQSLPTHERMLRQGAVAALVKLLTEWRASQMPPLYSPSQHLHVQHLRVLQAQGFVPPPMADMHGMRTLAPPGLAEIMAARHAASALSALYQNLDLHFELVGLGTVPLLVQLLSAEPGDPQVQSHTLAALMMAATNDPRHAAVVARAGTIPAILSLLQRHCPPLPEPRLRSPAGTTSPTRAASFAPASAAVGSGVDLASKAGQAAAGLAPQTDEGVYQGGYDDAGGMEDFAAAVLASLCRYEVIQDELLQADGASLLLQLLPRMHPGGEAASHAAEALTLIASVPRHRLRLAVRAPEAVSVCRMLLSAPNPSCQYWGCSLLNQLCAEPIVLEEVVEQGLTQQLVVVMQPYAHASPGAGDLEGGADESASEGAEAGGCAAVDLDSAAWAASHMLDAALARVQAAWVAAKLAAMEGGAGAAVLVQAGAISGLVGLLIEAVDAADAAAGAQRRAADAAATTAGPGAGQRAPRQVLELGCEWYQKFESEVMSALQKLQGNATGAARPPISTGDPAVPSLGHSTSSSSSGSAKGGGAGGVDGVAVEAAGGCTGGLVPARASGLQSNAGAAAAAALLGMANVWPDYKWLVREELKLQGKHPLGHLMFLAGIEADADK